MHLQRYEGQGDEDQAQSCTVALPPPCIQSWFSGCDDPVPGLNVFTRCPVGERGCIVPATLTTNEHNTCELQPLQRYSTCCLEGNMKDVNVTSPIHQLRTGSEWSPLQPFPDESPKCLSGVYLLSPLSLDGLGVSDSGH